MEYSLMVGRFQPLHTGHIALIRKVLDEGKNVCIGLKNTGKDGRNPYSVSKRIAMFRKEFSKEIRNKRIQIRILLDIDEIIHGRKVGWGIREIRLDKKTEEINATKIRQRMKAISLKVGHNKG